MPPDVAAMLVIADMVTKCVTITIGLPSCGKLSSFATKLANVGSRERGLHKRN